jgi:uncharacterized membrane protein YkvA (DUF1232 family)
MDSSSENHYLSSTHEATEEKPSSHRDGIVEKMMRFARTVGHFARLLGGLMVDERVDKKAKLFAAAVLAYVVSPIDFIPELFGGLFGMLDDFVLSAFALNVLLNWIDPKVVKEHWFGEEDLLVTIQKGIKNAEVLMPDAIMKKIEAWIGRHVEKALVPVVSRSASPVVEEKKRSRKSSRSKKTE